MQDDRSFAIPYDNSKEVVIASQANDGHVRHKSPLWAAGRRPVSREEALRLQTIGIALVKAVTCKLNQLYS